MGGGFRIPPAAPRPLYSHTGEGVLGKTIDGSVGKIVNPAVGLLIGEMTQWQLQARTDETPGPGDFILRASFSSISEWMFNDPAIPRLIVIEIGRGQQYRLEAADDSRTVLEGRSLLIEGVHLWRLEQL